MEEKTKLNDRASWVIFKNARVLRDNMTESEIILWENVLSKKKMLGYKFRKQHPFNIYILDFYCHELKLCIEVDGNIHDNKSQKEYDGIRTDYIENNGIMEIRFTNYEIKNNLEEVRLKIEEEIKSRKLWPELN